jgi:hypothetical protein
MMLLVLFGHWASLVMAPHSGNSLSVWEAAVAGMAMPVLRLAVPVFLEALVAAAVTRVPLPVQVVQDS